MPLVPSTLTFIPDLSFWVAGSFVLITTGIPDSRPTMAAWERLPPLSTIAALILLKSGYLLE